MKVSDCNWYRWLISYKVIINNITFKTNKHQVCITVAIQKMHFICALAPPRVLKFSRLFTAAWCGWFRLVDRGSNSPLMNE